MAMSDYTQTTAQTYEKSLVSQTYGWMTIALGITAMIGLSIALYGPAQAFLQQHPGIIMASFLVQIGLVIGIGWGINRMSVGVATALFLAYATSMGVLFGLIFLIYTVASLLTTFFATAGMFMIMAAYGYYTKRDLTSIGSLCFMGLIGIILGSILNAFFVQSVFMYWAITYIGIAVFIGLIAYDTQKIKQLAANGYNSGTATQKMAILCALTLYLDFVNLFILLLRIFGRRR